MRLSLWKGGLTGIVPRAASPLFLCLGVRAGACRIGEGAHDPEPYRGPSRPYRIINITVKEVFPVLEVLKKNANISYTEKAPGRTAWIFSPPSARCAGSAIGRS